MDYQEIIDKYYPAGSLRRDIYVKHCRQVAELALDLARKNNLPLDPRQIETAAMLHDIGIFLTNAPTIGCEGDQRYIMHGPLGADLLRREGLDETYARVAERHTGVGILDSEIIMLNLPIPTDRSYMPESLLERLVCYADKFYSKSGEMKRKDFRQARASIARHGGDNLARFDNLARQFGIPKDLTT